MLSIFLMERTFEVKYSKFDCHLVPSMLDFEETVKELYFMKFDIDSRLVAIITI